MRTARSVSTLCLPLLALAFVAISLTAPTRLHAQAGNNTVCTGSGTVPSWAACSASIFDATQASGTDICQKIYNVLSSSKFPSTGAVIDARGVTSGLNLFDCGRDPLDHRNERGHCCGHTFGDFIAGFRCARANSEDRWWNAVAGNS